MDIDQLSQVRIVSASKRDQSLNDTPAAAHVISSHEIEGSGFTHIPEMLRLAPGVQVARISPAAWAISTRGFNSQDSRKLLVLMDGRSVYSSLFSGVWWDVQDTLVDNIDRIEVVRGPGGATWGANAVNGVVNVISKPAAQTQGSLVQVSAGSLERYSVGLREGVALDEHTHLRVYGRVTDTDDFPLTNGMDGHNGYLLGIAGFRLDWDPSPANRFTLQGDGYGGTTRQRITSPTLTAPYSETISTDVEVSGGNLLGRWTHDFSAESQLTLQAYYDLTIRRPYVLDETRQNIDVEVRHQANLFQSHNLIYGTGYRSVWDDMGSGNFRASWDPSTSQQNLFSLFAQDDWSVVQDRWNVVGGARLEHNDYTDWEVQPTLRTIVKANENHSLWSAVSRATRTPDRVNDFRLRIATIPPDPLVSGSLPTLIQFDGNNSAKSEEVIAYEVGWRWQASARLSFDTAAFFNEYDNLTTTEPNGAASGSAPPHNILLATTGNSLSGHSYGVEVAARSRPLDPWQLSVAYTYMRTEMDAPTSPIFEGDAPNHPAHQVTLQSTHELGAHWRLDGIFRYTDKVTEWDANAYLTMDARLSWRPSKQWEFALVGQNLFDDLHFEAPSGRGGTPSTEVPRSVYGQITWRF